MKSERINQATQKVLDGFNWAQAVLYAFREEGGLSEELALQIACGLGAGMARKGEVCGAVTGGILVLGIRHGRGTEDAKQAREKTYAETRGLMEKFSEQQGTVSCRHLLKGCDLMTEHGQNKFQENDFLNAVCVPCVRSVIRILENGL